MLHGGPRQVRFSWIAAVLCALVLAACQTTSSQPPASLGVSPQPGATAGATPATGSSSQTLIAADLEAGTIDAGTALEYRVWALFRDARLPERYDGAGSTGDDPRVLRDIETALPSLSSDLKAALEPFLLRPTNPDSPFSRPPKAGISLAGYAAQATPEPTQCTAPWKWVSDEWSADGSADRGFRVWACATSAGEAKARSDIQTVLSMGGKLWPAMVATEPAGMGLPAPDTDAKQNDGNGKIDVYLLEDLAQCRQRGDLCQTITGSSAAVAQPDWPRNCAVPDFPANACSGYILLQRSYIGDPNLAGTFAHEFFHILQFAHNGWLRGNWYEEASATWAKWRYVGGSDSFSAAEKAAARENTYAKFRKYQVADDSLLRYDPSDDQDAPRPQYQAWAWPLFQAVKDPGAVFSTWSDLEAASSLKLEDIDAAVDRQLPFASAFREFAVWNAQPDAYGPPVSTGLDDVRWQEHEGLDDFPEVQHHLRGAPRTLELGKTTGTARVDALAAQYDAYQLTGDVVRQIKVDVTSLKNAANADLDVVAQITPGSKSSGDDPWRRISASGHTVVLCRDSPDDNVAFFEVVISNHAVERNGDDPAPGQRIEGEYTIEAKDKCDVPDGFEGTFSGSNDLGDWHGTVKFDRLPTKDLSDQCTNDPDSGPARPGQYCYGAVSGQVTWNVTAANDCSGTATFQLDTNLFSSTGHPTDYGVLSLDLTDYTYHGSLSAGYHKWECREPHENVRVWIAMGGEPRPIPPGFGLSDSFTLSGCGLEGCGTQSSTWDLRPTYRK